MLKKLATFKPKHQQSSCVTLSSYWAFRNLAVWLYFLCGLSKWVTLRFQILARASWRGPKKVKTAAYLDFMSVSTPNLPALNEAGVCFGYRLFRCRAGEAALSVLHFRNSTKNHLYRSTSVDFSSNVKLVVHLTIVGAKLWTLLCGQNCLLSLEACAAVTRARHQREAGLSVHFLGVGQWEEACMFVHFHRRACLHVLHWHEQLACIE